MFDNFALWLPASLLLLLPLWRLLGQAGLGGPWALLCLIPAIGPPIVLLILAFGSWPDDMPADPQQSSFG